MKTIIKLFAFLFFAGMAYGSGPYYIDDGIVRTGGTLTVNSGGTQTINGALVINGTTTGTNLNAANGLVKLNGTAQIPALDGSLLLDLQWAQLHNNPTSVAGLGVTNGSVIDEWGTKAVPTGVPVGTTDAQSLTGKTYNGITATSGTNTFTLSVGTAGITVAPGFSGTLGTASLQASSAFDTAGAAAAAQAASQPLNSNLTYLSTSTAPYVAGTNVTLTGGPYGTAAITINATGGGGGSPAGSTGDVQTNGGSGTFGHLTLGGNLATALTNSPSGTSGTLLETNGSAASLTSFPTFNQNTSGSAASFTGNLAGDVTGTQGATVIGANVVTNAKAAQMATNTIKGNNTGGMANAIDLTTSQVSTMLGLAPSATTDTTNASNITSGTLPAAQLPNPSASTLGGVQSITSTSHQFLTSISTSGVPAKAQPAAADISGLAASATTDATNAANISSGTLPSARFNSRSPFSNTSVTVVSPTTWLAQTGTMSAQRTITFPAASTYANGTGFYIADESGTVTSANDLIFARAGSDTINGATTTGTSFLNTAYGVQYWVSDGTSKWTSNPASAAGITGFSGDSTSSGSGTVALVISKLNGQTATLGGALTTGAAVSFSGTSSLTFTGSSTASNVTIPAGTVTMLTTTGSGTGLSGVAMLTANTFTANQTIGSSSGAGLTINGNGTLGAALQLNAVTGGGSTFGFFSTGSSNAANWFGVYDYTNSIYCFAAKDNMIAHDSIGIFGWASSSTVPTGALDTGLSRDSAGVVDFGTGSQGSSAGSWKATNGTLAGDLTFSTSTHGIIGTTTNDSAAAGKVGETVSSKVASGGAVTLTTATAANVTSISLTAGDWDVQGGINFSDSVATTTATAGSIGTASATLATDGTEVNSGVQLVSASAIDDVTIPRIRISVASTTTVYLVAKQPLPEKQEPRLTVI